MKKENARPSKAESSAVEQRKFTATSNTESRIDSRILAARLGIKHESLLDTIHRNVADFESISPVVFRSDQTNLPGRPARFALLTEEQAVLRVSYSRNRPEAVARKTEIARLFGELKRAIDLTQLVGGA